MTVHLDFEEARAAARTYTLKREAVNVPDMAIDLDIGWKRASMILKGFEAEGLISRPDRNYCHNVRQPNGELVQPAHGPNEPLDVRILGGLPASSSSSGGVMSDTDHLEIGTISFERCHGDMVLEPRERVRLILAAVEAYEPDLLVTAGHAVHSIKQLYRLARHHRELETGTTIITEVLLDGVDPKLESHAMWAITGDGMLHRFGQQLFARRSEVDDEERGSIASFERALPQRALAVPDWNLFALICGEINIVEGRTGPQFVSEAAEAAIMAADVVINPTHDRMGNAGTLDAKRRLLSRPAEDGRNRVYVSCSNWEGCGDDKGRTQNVTETLHTVYAGGISCPGEQLADGNFGFAYRRWALDL